MINDTVPIKNYHCSHSDDLSRRVSAAFGPMIAPAFIATRYVKLLWLIITIESLKNQQLA